jgi:hypothetical protein
VVKGERIGATMNYRTHFAHRIDMWDDDGENIIEHLAGIQNFEMALAAYKAAIAHWPKANLTLRQGTRVIEDSRKRRLA